MATIAENLQTILDIKNNIKDAIIAKGVSVADSDGFATYPSKIESIETGGSGGDGFDFTILGYDTTLNNACNDKIQADIDYSKTILDNWNPSTTSAISKFSENNKLVYCPNIDTINVTTMGSMFSGCTSLQSLPLLDTSNVTDMNNMFYNCTSLTTIPLLDTSNVTTMYYMFNGCSLLTSLPLLDTSNVTDMKYMFEGCSLLTTIPQLNTINVTTMYYMFNGCSLLTSLPLLDCNNVTNISRFFGYNSIATLTDLGGFKNLKIDWNDNYGLYKLPNLTYESVMNIINNLYDFRANGDTTTTKTIKFNANSIALLSDEDIAIATAKGWTIS